MVLFKGMTAFWRKIMKLGVFVSLSQLVSPLGLSFVNGVLATFGTEAIGAWNIMARLEMMGMLPLYGMAGALVPYMALNYGRAEWSRISGSVRLFLKMTMLIVIPIMCLLIFGAPLLVMPFSSDPRVADLAMHAIRVAVLAHILAPFELALMGTAQGLKRPWYSLTASSIRLLAFRYPLTLLFAFWWGIDGVFWSQPVSVAMTSVIAGILLWRLLRQIKAEIQDEPGSIAEGVTERR